MTDQSLTTTSAGTRRRPSAETVPDTIAERLAAADARARELVAQMTLEEKASLTSGKDFWHLKGVERLGVPEVMVTDGPHGLRKQAGEADHVGLNESVPATCFTPAVTLGSTWDPALARRVGEALGEEVASEDVAVVLGPGVNIKRNPLGGRNFEYVSEDPLLAGRIGAALVAGIQSQGVGTSLKHFAVNSQETERMRVSADVDERSLREIYLPAFERVVKEAQPWTVMCSYNKINGVHSSDNHWLLTEVLRDEWGFEGYVVSDWGATHERVTGLKAGLDLDMPADGPGPDEAIVAAVRDGSLDEAVLDEAVRRILRVSLAALPALEATQGYDGEAHHALVREAAAAGTVLLRNGSPRTDGAPVLPLDPAAFSAEAPLALIGELARTPRFQGSGSSQINPTKVTSALEGLGEALGDGVVFSPGYELPEAAGQEGQDLGAEELRRRAVGAARGRTAVVVAGLPSLAESEGFDRTDIDLPADQVALIRAVGEVAARTVVVLLNGSAVAVSDWEDAADALLEAWLGGQAGGAAIADVVLGTVAPSGHLAESIPLRLSHVPSSLNWPGNDGHVRYGEGVAVGYRGLDATDREVSYPFGHGLTYTSFSLETVELPASASVPEAGEDDDVVATVRVRLTNTGNREGAQVVQLYVGRRASSRVMRVPRELAAFEKVTLVPGESRVIELPLTRRAVSYWDVELHRWVVEPGAYELEAGFSSRDLPVSGALEIDAPAVVRDLTPDSTIGDWLDNPVGKGILEARMAPMMGQFGEAVEVDAAIAMIRSMPLTALINFPFTHMDMGTITAMLEDFEARRAERP